MTNSFSITPWVTHDQMVIQMFGQTETCVEIRPNRQDSNRGLVDGKFRIEYKNATGTVAVQGSDFGQDTLQSAAVEATAGANGGLLEENVCIERGPHYLSVCWDSPNDGQVWTGGACGAYCEYHDDYKQDEATVPIDMYGNYTVPCGKHDVVTFDGSNSLDNVLTSTVETQRVNALVFEDRCDADTFVALDGQILNIQGDLTGPLEFVINSSAYAPTDVVLEFYNDPEAPWTPQVVLFSDITGLSPEDENDNGKYRMFAFSKHGNSYVCYKGCESSDAPGALSECYDASIAQASSTEVFYGVEDDTITGGSNNYINSGLGDDTFTGAADSFDIYEDHGGNDSITGGTLDDLFISRGGGEIIEGKGDNGD